MIYDIFFVGKNKNSWKEFSARFPSAQLTTAETFDELKSKSFTKFFWVVWDDIVISDNFDFSYRVEKWDEEYIHVFKNGNYFDGVCLFPKAANVSDREFKNRFFANKKEIDVIASTPAYYETFYLDSYDDYLKAIEKTSSRMFWVVWSDIILLEKLEYQVPYYDQHIAHVFLNDRWYDGVVLFSKDEIISKKEFIHRFYRRRKEIPIKLSIPKPYDIFFISYNEPNADENYSKLITKFPNAKRVHGVKGIHNAHIEAARQSETEKFWVVDADAILMDDFNFETEYYPYYDPGNRKEHLLTVFVWHSKNPVNDLTYGYGGVKLLPKQLTLDMNTQSHDMTTSISDRFKVVPKVSNITAFNIDDFSTWRSAFRECAKLASKVIDSNYDDETDERLYVWCSKTTDKVATAGAREGRKFGRLNIDEPDELRKINDFDWLRDRYEKWKKSNEQ